MQNDNQIDCKNTDFVSRESLFSFGPWRVSDVCQFQKYAHFNNPCTNEVELKVNLQVRTSCMI